MKKGEQTKQNMRLYENATRLKLTTVEQLANASGLSLDEVNRCISLYNGIAAVMRENAKVERKQELYAMVMSVFSGRGAA